MKKCNTQHVCEHSVSIVIRKSVGVCVSFRWCVKVVIVRAYRSKHIDANRLPSFPLLVLFSPYLHRNLKEKKTFLFVRLPASAIYLLSRNYLILFLHLTQKQLHDMQLTAIVLFFFPYCSHLIFSRNIFHLLTYPMAIFLFNFHSPD